MSEVWWGTFLENKPDGWIFIWTFFEDCVLPQTSFRIDTENLFWRSFLTQLFLPLDLINLDTIFETANLLIAAGVIVAIIGFLGCCGAIKKVIFNIVKLPLSILWTRKNCYSPENLDWSEILENLASTDNSMNVFQQYSRVAESESYHFFSNDSAAPLHLFSFSTN